MQAVEEDLYDTMEDDPDPVYQPPRGPPRGPAPTQQPHSRPKVDLKKIRQNSIKKVKIYFLCLTGIMQICDLTSIGVRVGLFNSIGLESRTSPFWALGNFKDQRNFCKLA